MADGQGKDGQVRLEVQQAEQAQGGARAEGRIKCGAERQDGGKSQRESAARRLAGRERWAAAAAAGGGEGEGFARLLLGGVGRVGHTTARPGRAAPEHTEAGQHTQDRERSDAARRSRTAAEETGRHRTAASEPPVS